MNKIPYLKAHGAENDFLLTRRQELPQGLDLRAAARAICERNTGVGADGWLLVDEGREGSHAVIQLFNRDGSDSEISGNGTRCVAAMLVAEDVDAEEVVIDTVAGRKSLRLLAARAELEYWFEMGMGKAVVEHVALDIEAAGGLWSATVLNVGNPQCAVLVDSFEFDWERVGAALEVHAMFPNKSNVSFYKVAEGAGAIDVLFFERGVGPTRSSGTGSTGAALAARARGLAGDQIEVRTPAGSLNVRVSREGEAYLTGPAMLVSRGEFYLRRSE